MIQFNFVLIKAIWFSIVKTSYYPFTTYLTAKATQNCCFSNQVFTISYLFLSLSLSLNLIELSATSHLEQYPSTYTHAHTHTPIHDSLN